MDTVSNLPFDLNLIQKFPVETVQKAVCFSKNPNKIWENDFETLHVEENEELDLYFNSIDPNARMYLEALDIIPTDVAEILVDENGKIYKKCDNYSFPLYRTNEGYDSLRIDQFKISIRAFGEWYYGVLKINPKPMSLQDWQMMKEDLENEIRGFALDIMNQNITVSNYKNQNCNQLPAELMHAFTVINNFSKKTLMALMSIADNPRYEVKKEYEIIKRDKGDMFRFDNETIHRFASRDGDNGRLKVPISKINYDIQDNRILKVIISKYEKKLNLFIDMVNQQGILLGFKETALKLRKLTLILKSKEWYSKVGTVSDLYIPHSFIMDSRYNVMYQIFRELEKNSENIHINPLFSYTWKQSSCMYEMWCYLKVCRIILKEYNINSVDWNFSTQQQVMVPFLEEGTILNFVHENIRIEVAFDTILPTNRVKTSIGNPLFMARNHSNARIHNRPDITINIYENNSGLYLGSIILECKYRKINSFWYEGSNRSSRGQLEAYYNNARSAILLGNLGERLQIRPVTKVFVLTPDDAGEGREDEEFGIVVKGFKASDTQEREELLKQELFEEINNIIKRYTILYG